MKGTLPRGIGRELNRLRPAGNPHVKPVPQAEAGLPRLPATPKPAASAEAGQTTGARSR